MPRARRSVFPSLVAAGRDPRAARRYPIAHAEKEAVSRPQVIDDEEHERVDDRVAAVDVAKDSGTCAPAPASVPARRPAQRSADREGPDGYDSHTRPTAPQGRHRGRDAGVDWRYPGCKVVEIGHCPGRAVADASATRRTGSGGISAAVGCLRRGHSPDNPSATGEGTSKADRHLPSQTALSPPRISSDYWRS